MIESEDSEGHLKEDGISCPTQRDVEELRKKIKPPDRPRFERELEKINSLIRELENKYRSFQSLRTQGLPSNHGNKDRETLMTELRSYKAEREKEIDTRKKIDQELKSVSSLVQQKNDSCGKVQAGLKFKTESKADEAIRRLEHQLRFQQLKLREEKRLVTEIDSLRRSKKLINEFDALKQEIAQLREKQNNLRKQRDVCVKTITMLKGKEEEIKVALDEQRSKDMQAKQQLRGHNTERTAMKKEIDDLYNRKRSLIAIFNKEKEEYNSLLKDIREQEKHIKREVETLKRIEKKHSNKQSHGSESVEDMTRDIAHQTMINVCDSLIIYIKGLNINTRPQEAQATSDQPPEIKDNDPNFTGGSFLKKKMDNDLQEMYGGAARRSSRRGSRKGKKSASKENVPKKLVLHPLVLDQFFSVSIPPPSTAADVSRVLELLIDKKEQLESVVDIPVHVPRTPSPNDSSESSVESFPSLPSMSSDTNRPGNCSEMPGIPAATNSNSDTPLPPMSSDTNRPGNCTEMPSIPTVTNSNGDKPLPPMSSDSNRPGNCTEMPDIPAATNSNGDTPLPPMSSDNNMPVDDPAKLEISCGDTDTVSERLVRGQDSTRCCNDGEIAAIEMNEDNACIDDKTLSDSIQEQSSVASSRNVVGVATEVAVVSDVTCEDSHATDGEIIEDEQEQNIQSNHKENQQINDNQFADNLKVLSTDDVTNHLNENSANISENSNQNDSLCQQTDSINRSIDILTSKNQCARAIVDCEPFANHINGIEESTEHTPQEENSFKS